MLTSLIPRLNQDLIANGWAINTEYFAEVLHAMRDDLSYSALVDECLDVPAKADKRDMTAIKRLCTAFVKLLYPNARHKEDIAADEFIKYCLKSAFFLIQNLHFLESGSFVVTKRELKEQVPDEDRTILEMAELPDGYDYDTAFRHIFRWCQSAFVRAGLI